MMPFFPILYPDEILYSTIARYHIASGNQSIKATIKDVFGSKGGTAVMDLPSNINNLIHNLPIKSELTAEYIINNHTLLPFYGAFISPDRYVQIRDSMLSGNSKGIYGRIGIMASSIKANQYFQFCPICNKEDKEQYGEIYWHRMHQIPCILTCSRHHVPLYKTQVIVRGYNKHQYQAAREEDCQMDDYEYAYPEDVMKKLNMLADDAELLLNGTFERRPLEWFHKQYISKLMGMGFVTANGSIYQKKLISSFEDFYGNTFLRLVQSSLNSTDELNWLSDMLRFRDRASHPIRHLLLARFLGISLKDLFYSNIDYKPFGEGPWICLNAATEHYRQPVIMDLKITHNFDSKAPLGTFSCDCGFVYTRTGPDKAENDRYRYGRVKQFGQVWEAKLKELVDRQLTLRGTAKKLKVDPATVKKYAKRLGLNANWETKSSGKADTPNIKDITELAVNNILYRDKWLKLKSLYPDKSKTELRYLNQPLYTWLYKHDREWLNQNSPERPVKKNNNNRVNWKERDKEILQKVQATVHALLNSEEKPKRISIGLIGNILGIRTVLEKHLNRLPKTKGYLDSVKESDADYRIRRVQWAYKELQRKGESLQVWKIHRKAGIRKEYEEEVEAEIQRLLKI